MKEMHVSETSGAISANSIHLWISLPGQPAIEVPVGLICDIVMN